MTACLSGASSCTNLPRVSSRGGERCSCWCGARFWCSWRLEFWQWHGIIQQGNSRTSHTTSLTRRIHTQHQGTSTSTITEVTLCISIASPLPRPVLAKPRIQAPELLDQLLVDSGHLDLCFVSPGKSKQSKSNKPVPPTFKKGLFCLRPAAPIH